MSGSGKARVRVATVIVLLIVAAVALRGYLPGGGTTASVPPTSSLVRLFTVVALLTVTMAIFAIGAITQARRPSVPPKSLMGRTALIAVGAAAAWLLLAALLLPFRPSEPVSPSTVIWLLGGSAGLLVVGISVGSLVTRCGRRHTIPQQLQSGGEYRSSTRTGPEALVRVAEFGLAEIGDLRREPREAIIASYMAIQSELAKMPEAIAQGRSTTQLVELFEQARFSAHVMNEVDRDDAVRALRQVLAELQALS
jgi:hypothetical protein